MTHEQIIGILPLLLFVVAACIFLWVTRERSSSGTESRPVEPPGQKPGEAEAVAIVAALNRDRLAATPAVVAEDEAVAAIAAALRHQGKC
jgi:hypothetical protein